MLLTVSYTWYLMNPLGFDKKVYFLWKILSLVLAIVSGILCVIIFVLSGQKSDEKHLETWNTFSNIEKQHFEDKIENYTVPFC